MSESLKEINDTNFESEISNGVTLIDFFAEWCGPCRMLTPILDSLSQEMSGAVNFCKIDIDNCPKTTSEYNITSVPTLILFSNGKEVERVVGLRDQDSLKNLIEKNM